MDEIPAPRTRIRTIVVFSMLFAVLGAVVVFAYFATFSRPITTVILVRHGEKVIDPNNADALLTAAGQARAQELIHVLGNAGITAIYATQVTRTQQTAKPIADRLGLQANIVDAKNTKELVRQIASQHAGAVVLVVGHTNSIPEVIAALGGGSVPVIPETEYDNLYVVTLYRFGKARVVRLKYGNPSP
jgi:broad specificity phosphatase PhoE